MKKRKGKLVHFLFFGLFLLLGPAAIGQTGLQGKEIEQAVGIKPTYNREENVWKVTFPREDLAVTVDGVLLPPFMGLTSWAAFKPGMDSPAMVMGDIVLFQDEVQAAMDTAFVNGLTVTALHNHFFFDEPRVFFMHIGGEGSTAQLATGVHQILARVNAVRASAPEQAKSFVKTSPPASSSLSGVALATVMKGAPTEKNGMVKFTIGRTVTMSCGCTVGKEMGVNTWAAFYGSDANAIVDGDFVVFESELQPVLRSLRENGVNVVAIHNHMVGESPRTFFLHYWGRGAAMELARSVREALDLAPGIP